MLVLHFVAYLLFALYSTLPANRRLSNGTQLDISTVTSRNGAVARCNSSFIGEPVIRYNSSVDVVWQPLYHTVPVIGVRRLFIVTGSLSSPLRHRTLVSMSFVRYSYLVMRLYKLLPGNGARFRTALCWYGFYVPALFCLDGFVPSHLVVAKVVLRSHRGYVSRSALLVTARALFSGIKNRQSVFAFSEVLQGLFMGVSRIWSAMCSEIHRCYS